MADTDKNSEMPQKKEEVDGNMSSLNWADPDIPAGDAPPMPAWPLVVAVLAFTSWLVFLVVMAYVRVSTTPF